MEKQQVAAAALSQLLLSGTLVHEGEFQQLAQRYGVDVRPNAVLVISIDRYPDVAADRPHSWRTDVGHTLVEGVHRTTKELDLPCMWLWTEEGVLALLVDFRGLHSDKPRSLQGDLHVSEPVVSGSIPTPRELAEVLQRTLAHRGLSVSIGIGRVYDDPLLLYRSFHEATESMNARFFQGNQLIFEYIGHPDKMTPSGDMTPLIESHQHDAGGTPIQASSVQGRRLQEEITELLALVQMGDALGSVTGTKDILDNMAKTCAYNENLFRSEAIDLVMSMSRAVLDSGVSAAAVLSENARVIHELYVLIRYDKFVEKTVDYVEWLTRAVNQSQFPQVSPVIRNVIGFIKQHHRETLSLDDIARYGCLSKYHLSHRFKHEVGMSVIDFVNQIRIDKALFYLNTSDAPIGQVAQSAGYRDANYFSRLFKKRLGCTPSEYRIARMC